MSLSEYFVDREITNYIESKIVDSWKDTVFEGYSWLANTQMGHVGEILVTKIMLKNKRQVLPRINRAHDRIIDGYKTEIKFSLSLKPKHFTFNHLSCNKDWERTILMGANGIDDYYLYWFTKEEFIEHVKSPNNVFKHQQGGKKTKNDDYMFSGDIDILKSSNILHDLDSWLIQANKKIGIELWLSE